jgi:uncharacterized protein
MMGQTHLLWQGREYESLENCIVTTDEAGVSVNAVIVGYYQSKIYRVAYNMKLTDDWQPISCTINATIDGVSKQLQIEHDALGNWRINGKHHADFAGCTFIDIPLTPFTNSLPINNLKMKVGMEATVKIVYVDLLENSITAVQQQYTRRSEAVYHYENIPNDFEADITVDVSGFVIDYPELFFRKAIK